MPYRPVDAISGPAAAAAKRQKTRGEIRQQPSDSGPFRASAGLRLVSSPANATVEEMKIETRAVHAGRHIDPATGAVTPPICLSTTFERSPDGEYPRGFSYSRDNNPNRRALEECLADLEGGKEAAAFSSGLAVATAVVQGLEPGDHILALDDVYWGFRNVVGKVFGRWPLETGYVDMTDLGAVRAAIRPNTRLIWVETPKRMARL